MVSIFVVAAVALASTLPGQQVRIAVNKDTEPFWQAAKAGRLAAPQCADCGAFRLPPTPFCPACQSTAVNWVELSGDASVYSFAVVHGIPGTPELMLVAAVVGRTWFYYVTIGSVLSVLALSANTGFADFPRLCRAIRWTQPHTSTVEDKEMPSATGDC